MKKKTALFGLATLVALVAALIVAAKRYEGWCLRLIQEDADDVFMEDNVENDVQNKSEEGYLPHFAQRPQES